MNDNIKSIAEIAPSKRQLLWQHLEFYSFIHFSINTFTDREWGKGDEDPDIFNPTEFNAEQWVKVCKAAGMKGMILTCKHLDGFCLWPSKYTEHSVKNSPFKDGRGDVVKEVSEACANHGLKFGIYLSPWDRHEKTYGDSDAYNEYFKNQLKELLTGYGEIFSVWFDGACGEGLNGKKQIYDWNGYYDIIRECQPDAVISVCGPDVRWCGNEAGHTRKSEWSVVPKHLLDAEKIAEESQKIDDGKFSKKINSSDDDLGSRDAIKDEKDLIWYPAEVDTSIRPGWFYHAAEDGKVRSLTELLKIYYGSVGGNACLLLNIPPDKRGLIHESDEARLVELGRVLNRTFKNNLMSTAKVKASETLNKNHIIENAADGNDNTYWSPKEGTESASINIDLTESKSFDTMIIQEYIKAGQRVEEFTVEAKTGGEWRGIYQGTVIGYKHICRFEKTDARYLKVTIKKSRWCPAISNLGIYTEKA